MKSARTQAISCLSWLMAIILMGTVNIAHAQTLVVLVHDEQDKPLPGAHVSLRDARDRGVKPTAKQDGVFTFEEVPEGYDALQVKASGMQMNGCQWFVAMPDTVRVTMHMRSAKGWSASSLTSAALRLPPRPALPSRARPVLRSSLRGCGPS